MSEKQKNEPLALVEIVESCKILIQSNFELGFKSVQDAIIATKFGTDLGLTMSASWINIDVIKGKPALNAKAKLGLVLSNEPNFKFKVLQRDDKAAKIQVWQDKNIPEESLIFEWNLEDARKAELIDKPMWNKYKRQMLWSRVISEMADTLYPQYTSGIYTPEQVQFFEDPKPIETREKELAKNYKIENAIDVDLNDIPPKEEKGKKLKREFEEAKSKGFEGTYPQFREDYFNKGIEFVPTSEIKNELEKEIIPEVVEVITPKIEKENNKDVIEEAEVICEDILESGEVKQKDYPYLTERDVLMFNKIPVEFRHKQARCKNAYNLCKQEYNFKMITKTFMVTFFNDNHRLDFKETIQSYKEYINKKNGSPDKLSLDKFIQVKIDDLDANEMFNGD